MGYEPIALPLRYGAAHIPPVPAVSAGCDVQRKKVTLGIVIPIPCLATPSPRGSTSGKTKAQQKRAARADALTAQFLLKF